MITVLSQTLFTDLIARASVSPRKRMHQNLHESYSDPCQRLLNAISSDSYICPHRHALDPKLETLICLKGRLGVLLFDDSGKVTEKLVIGQGGHGELPSAGVEVAPSTWHTVVSLEPWSILLEIKAGPFNPNAAKEPAGWAPAEGSSEAAAYLAELQRHFS